MANITGLPASVMPALAPGASGSPDGVVPAIDEAIAGAFAELLAAASAVQAGEESPAVAVAAPDARPAHEEEAQAAQGADVDVDARIAAIPWAARIDATEAPPEPSAGTPGERSPERPAPAEAVIPGTAPEAAPAAPTRPLVGRGLEKLEGIDPAFRAALEHTIGRMVAEGHSVRIVETSRTQARQDALFAQGRTEPGPVVTWTRQSRHLVGRAADLQVDGAWTGAGYARLQAIAREEGLHTLGARDPGHVELRVDSRQPTMPRTTAAAVLTGEAMLPQARLATAAGAAVPHPTSADAPSRTVAVPWERPGPTTDVRAVPPFPAARPPVPQARELAVLAAARARAVQLVRALGEPVTPSTVSMVRVAAPSGERRAPMEEPVLMAVHELLGAEPGWAEDPAPQSLGGHAPRATPERAVGTAGPEPAGAAEPARTPALLAQRIEQLFARRDHARTAPLSSITLAVDAVNGTTDHVRIGLAGRALDATILTDDPAAARAMSRDLGGLSDALARTGVEASAVTVHDVASVAARQGIRTAEPGDAAQPTVTARLGAVEGLRPASAAEGDAGGESRRHDRDASQRQGGESSRQQGEQRDPPHRDSQHRRHRPGKDEQAAAGRFRFPFPPHS